MHTGGTTTVTPPTPGDTALDPLDAVLDDLDDAAFDATMDAMTDPGLTADHLYAA